MTEWLAEYALFLAKMLTLVAGILVTVFGLMMLGRKRDHGGVDRIEIKHLNAKYHQIATTLHHTLLPRAEFKRWLRGQKHAVEPGRHERRLFVINFDGDLAASALVSLREEISAILTVARDGDEVFLRLHSAGGMVHAYGLAASQLLRLRARGLHLTVAVDKIAASGGYLMACVADRILAAPFAVIGSIGVIAQIPNFNRLLKRHDIDFEQLTAGEFKRTLTLFGENTDKARAKLQEDIEDILALFKEFIANHRPMVDVDRVASGEHWPATRAISLKLVDELLTSDDYLLQRLTDSDIYELHHHPKRSLGARLSHWLRANFRLPL